MEPLFVTSVPYLASLSGEEAVAVAETPAGSNSFAGFLIAAGLAARANAVGKLKYLRHLGT